jgi:hypothetical protein
MSPSSNRRTERQTNNNHRRKLKLLGNKRFESARFLIKNKKLGGFKDYHLCFNGAEATRTAITHSLERKYSSATKTDLHFCDQLPVRHPVMRL